MKNLGMLGRTVISVFIELIIVATLVSFINFHESVPYNVRELFASSAPVLTIFLFSLVLYIVFGTPVWLASWLTVESWTRHLLFPLLVAALAVITWFLLRGSVAMESLDDIIGSPILDWPWEWELIFRFTALFTAFAILFCGAALLVQAYHTNYKLPVHIMFYWSIHATLFLPLVYWVVVCKASTDNLTELMARGGDVFSSIILGVWIVILGLTASLTTSNIVNRRLPHVILCVIFICSVPVGYLLLEIGTEDAVYKYGKIFSAMQFLLSQDRTNLSHGFTLMLRYSIAHIALIVLMGICQYPFWQWEMRTRQTAMQNQRPPVA